MLNSPQQHDWDELLLAAFAICHAVSMSIVDGKEGIRAAGPRIAAVCIVVVKREKKTKLFQVYFDVQALVDLLFLSLLALVCIVERSLLCCLDAKHTLLFFLLLFLLLFSLFCLLFSLVFFFFLFFFSPPFSSLSSLCVSLVTDLCCGFGLQGLSVGIAQLYDPTSVIRCRHHSPCQPAQSSRSMCTWIFFCLFNVFFILLLFFLSSWSTAWLSRLTWHQYCAGVFLPASRNKLPGVFERSSCS